MLEVMGGFVVVGVAPFVLVVGLLLVADGRRRRKLEVVYRQIALTDAIHRELGAVVAPVLERDRRSWRVRLAVPFECPGLVERVLKVVHASFPQDGYAVVLTPRRRQRIASSIGPRGRATGRRPTLVVPGHLSGKPAA